MSPRPSCLKRLAVLLILLFPSIGNAKDPLIADDFVTVSLVVAEPGFVLYSRLGHAALHMECPTYDLDYVYSYESENILQKPLAFLAGKTKMGMTAIPFEEYVGQLEEDGRGAVQYRLNLPIESKRELWRELDNRLEEGMYLKYDFLRRGCAHSALVCIEKALGNEKIQFGRWPDSFYGNTRREIVSDFLASDKWTRALLHMLCGGVVDSDCLMEDKVILPSDLAAVLSNSTVAGVRIIDSEPQILVEGTSVRADSPFTPIMAALLILLFSIVFALKKWKAMDYILLFIQSAIGILLSFLLLFSSLVCTEWNWLIIPFNPLPLIFWRWRCLWQIPYAVILVLWCALMIFWPHQLTDPVYIVFAFTLALSYITVRIR